MELLIFARAPAEHCRVGRHGPCKAFGKKIGYSITGLSIPVLLKTEGRRNQAVVRNMREYPADFRCNSSFDILYCQFNYIGGDQYSYRNNKKYIH